MGKQLIRGRALVAGEASGEALVSSEPLSFWGGYDSKTGEVIDRRHPLSGEIAAGRILVIPFTKGSSTTTAVLLESIREATSPRAIITEKVDPFLALASIVANEMYSRPIPVIAVEPDDFKRIESGQWLEIQRAGTVVVSGKPRIPSNDTGQ